MTKYYVSIGSQEMFTIEKETHQEVIKYMFENYNLAGYEEKVQTENTLFFYTYYNDQPYQTQCSISLEEAIDLDGWQESLDEKYERQQNEIDAQEGKFDWLVEHVYLGKHHEPAGIYSRTTVDNVKASLLEEVDTNGYFEELEDGCLKFISPNNEPSYWIVGQY